MRNLQWRLGQACPFLPPLQLLLSRGMSAGDLQMKQVRTGKFSVECQIPPPPCPGESLHAGSFTWGCMGGWIFGDLRGDQVESQSTCYDPSHIPFPLIPQEVPYILFLMASCLAGCPLRWVFQHDSSLRICALAHEKQDVPLPHCPFSSPWAALSGQWNASHSPCVCPVSWVILLWTLLSWLGGWKGKRKHPLQRPLGETSSR